MDVIFSTYFLRTLANFSYLMIAWSLWFVYKMVAFSFLFGIILTIQSLISLWRFWISEIVCFCSSWSKGKCMMRLKYYSNLLKSFPFETCWLVIWLFTTWLRSVVLLTTSLIAAYTIWATLTFFEGLELFKWSLMFLNLFNSSITAGRSL